MMEKAVLLVLLAALLVGPAAADGHITFSEEAVTYAAQSSDTVSTTWKCDSSSGDCVSATVEICGESFDANLNDNNNYEIDFSVPGDVACTNGTHSPFKVEDSNGNLLHDGGSLKVNPKNMGRGGDYLYVTVDSTSDNPDTKSDYKLRNWVVSENPWGKNPEIHKGQIGIEEIDPFVANTHEYCTYWVEDGRISRDESLSSSVLANKTGDCDGSSDSGSGYPDQIFNLGFTSSNTEDLRPGNLRDDLNTWNPVHKNGGEYTPRGDLIRGELFSGKMQLSDSGDGTEFFVCDLKTDETTVRTDSDGTKLYSCDANLLQKDDWRINGDSGGREVFDWDRVYVCSDGNDNDGDGLKDLDDPECNNDWKHNSEAPPGGCPKAVVTVGDLLEEKAVWDKSGNTYTHPDYPGCSWGEVQENPSAPTRSPETFLCSRDTLANEGLGDEEKTQFCNSLPNLDSYWNGHGNNMKAVEYHVSEEYIPTGASRYVTTGGYKTEFRETIHDAEQDWYERINLCNYSDQIDECPTPTDSHDKRSYIFLGMDGLEDGYDTSDWSELDPHWGIINSSVSEDTFVADKSRYAGGFVPDCIKGYTLSESEGEWKCTPESNQARTMKVRFYSIKRPDSGNYHVGFEIPEDQITEKWAKAHPEGADDLSGSIDGDGIGAFTVRAQCFVGAQDERPSGDGGLDKVVNLTAEYDGSGPLRVIGEPKRRSSDSIQHDKFSCIFGFQQRVDELEGNFATEGRSGSRFIRDIKQGETMIPGSDSNGDGTISVSEQQTWLENHASDTLPDGTDPFSKFGKGSDISTDAEKCNHPILDYEGDC